MTSRSTVTPIDSFDEDTSPGRNPWRHRSSHAVRDALERAGRLLISLEARVDALEQGEHDLTARLVAAEQHSSRLMSLYVATYQLHSTLDPADVERTIGEIAVNLLGAERYALLVRADGEDCDVAAAELAGDEPGFANGRYVGGDPMIDATLADGQLRIAPCAGSRAAAVIPLSLQGTVVGAVALLDLLSHRPPIDGEDREIFDLVSAHAASALLAARAYATKDRKLRTLQSMVELMRGGTRS
jgi:GAF domain-containing protein